jgi:hypothetical protein
MPSHHGKLVTLFLQMCAQRRDRFSCIGVGRGVKYVFLGLRRQLRCQAKGKNTIQFHRKRYVLVLLVSGFYFMTAGMFETA